MTRSDDEQTPRSDGHDDVIAKVRASLRGAAARTPIGADRLHEIRVTAARRPTVGWLQIAASVVAVAAIGGTVAVLQGGHQSSNSVGTGSGGKSVGSSSQSATPIPSPAPVGGSVAPTWARTPVSSGGSCIPENYYVIAAPPQVDGMTYILPSTPAGYQLYGAWGTISRNNCMDSSTWYVEYDNVQSQSPIQLSVERIAGGGPNTFWPSPSPVAAVPVTVAGNAGWFFSKDSYGTLIWRAGGLGFQLSGPITGGKPDALVAVAESFALVAATDPRIVAPKDCQVPPGSTCPSSTDGPTPTVTPTPNDTSVSTETPTSSPAPNGTSVSTETATASPPDGPPPTPTPTRSPAG
jgi:hypothetical protein